MHSPTATSPTGHTESIPHELREFAQDFAVAVHKRGIYPAAHPMQLGAVETVVARLQHIFAMRHELAIGVARTHLLLDGHPTDEEHPLLRDLAGRMHDHQLGGVRLMVGISRDELDGFVAALSDSPLRGGEPIGSRARDLERQWPHIHISPVAFHQLALLSDDAEDGDVGAVVASRASEVWTALAQTALAGGEGEGQGSGDGEGSAVHQPAQLAASIERRLADPRSRDQVLTALLRAVDELESPEVAGDGGLRQRVTSLVELLSEEAIQQLLEMNGDRTRRDAFLHKASDVLGAQAVVDLVRVAAAQDGAPVSSAMLRLLQKLARGASRGRNSARSMDAALRRATRRLLRDWTLDDPNPEAYSLVLGDLAQHAGGAARDQHRDSCEPERIVEMSLDAGVVTTSTESALGRLVMREGVAATLERLMKLPESPERDLLEGRLVNDAMLREQLAAERPDQHVLGHAVDRLRARAIDPILQALVRRDEQDAEWAVALMMRLGFDALVPLGQAVPTLPPRALRHVLAVFDRLDAWPPGVEPAVLARHPDAAVRREAIRYLLKHDATRDAGTMLGLRDADLRTFGLAMSAVMRACTIEAARLLMHRYDDPDIGAELRSRMARAIASVRTSETLDWLVAQVLTTRWIVGSVRLRKSSLEVRAIIAAIAQFHRGEPAAEQVLRLAERSRDDDLRRAASARLERLGGR
ncbi:MAG: hypothetical protein IPF87_18775 [Gemmatimonadetes bacterium]|nr:hypothetical protein [Gemmatimonadota bacterium]